MGKRKQKSGGDSSRDPAVDPRLIRALGHPTRDRILRTLWGGEASPADLAKELDIPLGHLAYHFRVLLQCDAIELVRTEPVRGTLKHVYRPIIRPYLDDKQWESLPLATRRAMDAQSLGELWEHMTEAAAAGGFDDKRTHMSWVKLELDEEAYEELAAELGRVLDRALELQGETANRDADLSAEEREERAKIRTELALMHFLRANGAAKAGKKASKPKRRRRVVAS